MKILFLARLYKPHVGGVEKHVEEISKILHKRHQITLVVEQHDENLPLHEKYPECEVFRIPLNGASEKSKKIAIWKWWLQNLDLIKNADVIHVHDVFFWLLPFRIFFPWKKIFITFHGHEGLKKPSLKQIFWHKIGEILTLGNICIGDFLKKWYLTRPNLISYGGISIDNFAKTAGKQKSKYAFLGRLAPDTGILTFLSAIRDLNIVIDVFGDGPLKQEAKKISEKNKLKVNFLGFVRNADKLLSQYKVIFTGGYLSILESLTAKSPVVAFYDSNLKFDYLSMAPFSKYIDICGNESEISAAAERINSGSSEIQSRVTAGYNWARTQTWEKLAKSYEDLWNRKI